jgi:hypothetical protein
MFFGQVGSGSKLRQTGTTSVNGQRAIVITGTDDGANGALTIASKGKPYILKIDVGKGTSEYASITFSKYNESVNTSVPKNAVNLNKV